MQIFAVGVYSKKSIKSVSVSQSFSLNLRSESYVIAPGVVYDGNRFLVSKQPYCPHIPSEGIAPDGPVLITDLPRLTADTGYRIDLAANALTTPTLGIFDPDSGRGVLVELPVYGDWGVSGIALTALPGEDVTVTVSLPVQRSRRYRNCDWVQAEEPGMDWIAGQVLEAHFRVLTVKAETIPGFLAILSRRAFDQRARGQLKNRIHLAESLRTVADLVESKLDAFNWDDDLGFYRRVSKKAVSPVYVLQIGWSGGGVTMLALLLSPNLERRQRARRMMTFLCQGAAPSGYFYGGFDGEKWLSFGLKRPGCQAFAFVRRPLECGRDLLKALNVMEGRGETVERLWLDTTRKFLDAVVRTEAKFGHLGYTIDPESGDVLWGPSAAGSFAIEALVLGYHRFGDTVYLETACRLARYYRDNFLLRGYTLGGVGDALMAVDSESSYALLAGLVHLHEATSDPEHLNWAVEAADLFQTWVLLYDAKMPEGTPLHKLGIEARGAVFANIQNQHGASGIYIASGIELATLARLTGDDRYLILLLEIVGCIPQMVVRSGQADVWGDLPEGALSERLMTMDGLEPAGHTALIDTFSEVALICANELPPELLGA